MAQKTRPDSPAGITADDVIQISVPENNGIPNHPWWPALIYPQAVPSGFSIEQIMALYEANLWTRVWAYTIFDYHHFHHAVHEVLTVAKGSAQLHLGGEHGPRKNVKAGDAIILPAGFGHKRLDATSDFIVVGGYPRGQDDVQIISAGEEAARAAKPSIAETPLPEADPIYGRGGLIAELWPQP